MRNGTIYAIKLIGSNEYRYVGLSVQPEVRFRQHINSTKNGKTLPINNFIKKYGENNVEWIELEVLPENKLKRAEQKWILKLKSEGHNLLNLTDGGEGIFGFRHSEEQKQKWSEMRRGSITGDKNPNYGKFGKDHPAYGRVLSEETKQRLSQNKSGTGNPNYGKKISDETKQKMSDSQKGKPKPSSSKSAHTRYHANKNVVSDKCKHCIKENYDYKTH
jgi:group I intron endonuclease